MGLGWKLREMVRRAAGQQLCLSPVLQERRLERAKRKGLEMGPWCEQKGEEVGKSGAWWGGGGELGPPQVGVPLPLR